MEKRNWTKDEDDILIEERMYGSSYAKIANVLEDRSRHSVRHRWETIRDKIDYITSFGRKKEKNTDVKILIFDIETSPLIVYSWGAYQQFIRPENVIKDWFVISWAGKWLHSKEKFKEVLTPSEAKEGNDKRIVSKLWQLFDEADIIVAHNCDRFDKKKMNWRFLIHGFPPPLSYRTVDTIKVARKYFSATSNKLDYLTEALRIGRKTETGGFDLWANCMNGDSKALAEMLDYNVNDIDILEKLYLELLPWITNHPNLGLYSDAEITVCPACGSTRIKVADKVITTAANAYYQYRCLDCNHVGRTKQHATTLEKRKVMVSN